ncbi:MAG: adenosine-specific kinase [Anaerolineaceae bacterium]|nr:adenosine-specific kinase [Anaerolineaceae bacterium]
MELSLVQIQKPLETNFILGNSHFIKTVEDIHEVLVNTVPGIQFGLAFCEASGKRLIRWSGTNDDLIKMAQDNALAIGAGHSFILFLGDGYYPINILRLLKDVPEVVNIFCATANPTNVIIASEGEGRGIIGVIDGDKPLGVEGDDDIAWRKNFLRMIGYKQ